MVNKETNRTFLLSKKLKMSSLQQVDFPIAFAEAKDDYQQIDDNTVFYVEWLNNSSEFPGLEMPTNTDLDGSNWELLERKETIEDKEEDHTVVLIEDTWSKIISSKDRPLYADMVEKNAAKLQPTKRTLQPLWSTVQLQNKPQENATEIDEDLYEDGDLGAQLLIDYKSQSRGAHRLLRRHNLHVWRITDYFVPGILRLTTTTKGWMPPNLVDHIAPSFYYPFMIKFLGMETEAEAKKYAARMKNRSYVLYVHFMNFKKDRSRTKPLEEIYDRGECSVLSPIWRR
jgi:hypothetical protein